MQLNVENEEFVNGVKFFEQEYENYTAARARSWNAQENQKFLDQMFFKAGEAAIVLCLQIVKGMPEGSKHIPDTQKLEHLQMMINMHIQAKNAGIELDDLNFKSLLNSYKTEVGIV